MTAPTIPTSTAPGARKWVFDQVDTAVSLRGYSEPGVTVYLGNLSNPDDDGDVIIIGRKIVRNIVGNQIVGGGGRGWLDETYTMTVSITCSSHSGFDFTDCDARAYELLGLVEQVVRADPSLNGLVIVSKPGIADVDSEYDDNHGGAQTTVESEIGVHARI